MSLADTHTHTCNIKYVLDIHLFFLCFCQLIFRNVWQMCICEHNLCGRERAAINRSAKAFATIEHENTAPRFPKSQRYISRRILENKKTSLPLYKYVSTYLLNKSFVAGVMESHKVSFAFFK